LCIYFTSEYTKGINECIQHHHGRLTLQKGDKPITTRDLRQKLETLERLGPMENHPSVRILGGHVMDLICLCLQPETGARPGLEYQTDTVRSNFIGIFHVSVGL